MKSLGGIIVQFDDFGFWLCFSKEGEVGKVDMSWVSLLGYVSISEDQKG